MDFCQSTTIKKRKAPDACHAVADCYILKPAAASKRILSDASNAVAKRHVHQHAAIVKRAIVKDGFISDCHRLQGPRDCKI